MRRMKWVRRNVGIPVDEKAPVDRIELAAEVVNTNLDEHYGALSIRIRQWEPCVIMDVYGNDREDVALYASMMTDRVVHVNTVLPNDGTVPA